MRRKAIKLKPEPLAEDEILTVSHPHPGDSEIQSAREAETHTTHLCRVGHSVMLAVPAAMLDALRLCVGSKVRLATCGGRLVVEPQPRPRYSLDELLSWCDSKEPRSGEDVEWLETEPVGGELL